MMEPRLLSTPAVISFSVAITGWYSLSTFFQILRMATRELNIRYVLEGRAGSGNPNRAISGVSA